MAKTKETPTVVLPDQSAIGTQRVNEMYAQYKPELRIIPFEKLRADYTRNVRVKSGMNLYGVTFKKDAYDTDGMKDAIIGAGCVREPLLVAERSDGTYEILRGFRRFTAVAEIHADGKELPTIEGTRNLSCLVVSGLSKQVENVLINDQSAKQFNSLEILLEVWRRLSNGETWYDICLSMHEQIGRITGGYAKSNEINAETDPKKKVRMIKQWLNTYVNQFLQGIFLKGGPQVQKWLVLNFKEDSGLLTEGEEKAPFKVSSVTWLQSLYPAIQADIKSGEVTEEDVRQGKYGKEFHTAVEKLSAPRQPRGTGNNGPELKDGKDIENLANLPGRSAPLKDAMMVCFKNETRDLASWDAIINSFLAKKQQWEDSRGMMPEIARELFKLAFDPAVSKDDFSAQIAVLIDQHEKDKETVRAGAERLSDMETQILRITSERDDFKAQSENQATQIETLTSELEKVRESARPGKVAKK